MDIEVEIDPRLASVALSHLLENAALYSPADGEILVRARVKPDGLHVSVTDHGPGLDPRRARPISSSASTAAAPLARRRLAPGWGCRSPEGWWRRSGGRVWAENVPAPARGSRSSCQGRHVPSRWRTSHGGAHPHRRRRTEHHRHRGALCCGRAGTRSCPPARGRAAWRRCSACRPDLRRARSGPAGYRRRGGVPPGAADVERADPGALGTRCRGRQGACARRRCRRLRDQAVWRRRNCSHASGPLFDVSTLRRRRANQSSEATSSSIGNDSGCVRDGEDVRLTPKEFELLALLAQHPGRVLTHRAILKAVWGPNAGRPARASPRARGFASEEDRGDPVEPDGTSSPSHGSGTASRMSS